MGRGTSAVDHGGEARAEAGRARWAAAVEARTVIFTEGAVIERLRRDRRFELDPHAAHAPFIYTPRGQGALEDLWRGYAAPIRQAGFPVIVCAPTWRASPERLRRANLPDVATVSRDAVALLARWRSTCGDDGPPIFMGALLGCRGDAYRPEEALDARSAAEYHRPQAEALAEAGPDLLLASTLPAFSEALGLAQALAATGRSYGLSFVLRPSGTLLDGSPLAEAVARIDDAVAPAPTFYLGGCGEPAERGRPPHRASGQRLPEGARGTRREPAPRRGRSASLRRCDGRRSPTVRPADPGGVLRDGRAAPRGRRPAGPGRARERGVPGLRGSRRW